MPSVFHHMYWAMRGVRTFALVGKSGSGKSFRAKLIADKYGIELIIDDGLLIRDRKILAGKSAKKAKAMLGAVRTALFDDADHRHEVRKALEKERKFNRVLVIGTSDKMVIKIAHRLSLPAPQKIIRIEDVASTEEIERAIHSRNTEGKHVIPVPAVEINRDYPHIFYDSVRVFLKRRFGLKKNKVFEKTVVRPEFSKVGRITISESALTQMVLHCAAEFDESILIRKVSVREDAQGYRLGVFVHIPLGANLSGKVLQFQEYLADSLQRFTGVVIHEVNIQIDTLSARE